MNNDQVFKFFSQSSNTAGAPMRRAIVHDPKDTSGLVIGRLRHDLSNKAVKGRDSTALFTAAKHFGSVDIQCRQIGPCTTALILMFDLHRRAGLGGLGGIDAGSGLDAGLFIGGQNKFIVLEQLLFPNPFVQIEDTTGFCGELRIARKDPAAVLPGTNGILVQPAPHGAVADGGHQARPTHFPCHIGGTPSRKGQSVFFGQLTDQGLNLNDDLRGGKPGGDPGEGVLPVLANAARRNVYATC